MRMSTDLVFKAGWVKRALGWLVFLGAGAALLAMLNAVRVHWATQTTADLWSGVAIGVFLIAFMVAGIAIQNAYWRVESDTIIFHYLFRTKHIPVSELAGFGRTMVIAAMFPIAHIDLYDRELKPVLRLPISIPDLPKAEAWFAERLRYVVNDGSPALPRRRFADTPRA
jgi:hypothetical protein